MATIDDAADVTVNVGTVFTRATSGSAMVHENIGLDYRYRLVAVFTAHVTGLSVAFDASGSSSVVFPAIPDGAADVVENVT